MEVKSDLKKVISEKCDEIHELKMSIKNFKQEAA